KTASKGAHAVFPVLTMDGRSTTLTCLLDSQALRCNVIDRSVLERLGWTDLPTSPGSAIRLGDGSSTPVSEVVELMVNGDKVKLHVLDTDKDYDILLGESFLLTNGLILDYSNGAHAVVRHVTTDI